MRKLMMARKCDREPQFNGRPRSRKDMLELGPVINFKSLTFSDLVLPARLYLLKATASSDIATHSQTNKNKTQSVNLWGNILDSNHNSHLWPRVFSIRHKCSFDQLYQ